MAWLLALAIEGRPPPQTLSPKDQAKFRAEWPEKRKQLEAEGLDQIRIAMNERLQKAYEDGEAVAFERADRNSWNARSITLYLVVLAVVGMPVVAMLTRLDPETFGSYIAPVTGIAGTVVGYWFGTISRQTGDGKT